MNKQIFLLLLLALAIVFIFTWTKEMIEVAIFFTVWGYLLRGLKK